MGSKNDALVVQLVETPGLNPAQYGFESHRGHRCVVFRDLNYRRSELAVIFDVDVDFVAP